MAGVPDTDERGAWYPVFDALFRESRFEFARELRAGLESVGVRTRMDDFGAGDCRVQLVSAWTPEPVGERAERWLAERARPFDEGCQWGVSVSSLPVRSDDVVPVWSGSWEDFERLGAPGHSYAAVGGGRAGSHPVFYCLQRGGPALLDCLPNWRRSHGETLVEGEESRWLVLDGSAADGVPEVDIVLAAVQKHGLTTCRYERLESGSVLAFVDTGVDGSIEELEAQVLTALAPHDDPSKRRFYPGMWSRRVVVRMLPAKSGWQAVEWLPSHLDGALANGWQLRDQDVVAIDVPVTFVDRAIELLDHWEQDTTEHL